MHICSAYQRFNIQSGLLVLGLAITIPDAAPDARDPEEPIFARIPSKANGLSSAIQESKVPVTLASSWAGEAKAPWNRGKAARDNRKFRVMF